MDLKKLETQTHQSVDVWIDAFRQYDFENILQKPSDRQWSLGQVGIHLWMSAKGFFFKNAERCLMKEGTQVGKGKNLSGHIVFTLRMMPPVKYEMPKQVAVEPKQPESKEQLIKKLEEVKQIASSYIARIPDSDPVLKTRHPFLGWLNTAEWISLCNIHCRHHLRQKRRIEEYLASK